MYLSKIWSAVGSPEVAVAITSGGSIVGLAVHLVERRRDHRAFAAAMTRPARDDLSSVEVVAIDGRDHLDHPARGALLGRVVLPFGIGRSRAGMAIAAADGQRRGKQPHRAHEFVDRDPFQDLHVLEDLIGHLQQPAGAWPTTSATLASHTTSPSATASVDRRYLDKNVMDIL